MDGNVTEIGAVAPVGQRAPCPDQPAIYPDEALVPAVGEDRLEMLRLLVPQRSDSVQIREFRPVDGSVIEEPFHASGVLRIEPVVRSMVRLLASCERSGYRPPTGPR